MKNITVSLPDETYRKARVLAAQCDTSVSALVREFLEQVGEASEIGDRRQRLLNVIESIRKARASGPHFRASDRLSRAAVHDRDALR